MIAKNILANMSTDEDYKTWIEQINDQGRNYESPFGVNPSVNNNNPSAQEMSNAYMLMKQRKPFALEFYEKEGDKTPKSITMYINPERMQISNQKIIGKQHTRGGIFYHHWGADHSTMSLNGTTGLAGMAGIKQLEEVYYASGTLLRYDNYTPTQIYGSVESYKTIDYSDPISVIENVVTESYSSDSISDIQLKLWEEHKSSSSIAAIYKCIDLLELHKGNKSLNDFVISSLPKIYADIQEWEKHNPYLHYRRYYQKMIDMIRVAIPNVNDNIIVNMAYELSLPKIYSGLPELEKKEVISGVKKDTTTSVMDFQKSRDAALKDHIKQLKDFEQRDKKIQDILRSGLMNIKEDMMDPWMPRQITIYFENRAYVGHFDSFSYNRDGKTNLINYEMRFTITKQYEFNNISDGIVEPLKDIIQAPVVVNTPTPVKTPITPTTTPAPVTPPKPSKNEYTVVSGDTLNKIAKKFYSNGDLWPEIYAANINKINDPELIHPGQIFTIPKLPTGYKTWVVLPGNTLNGISRRFYGTESKYKIIWEANKSIIPNPNLIHPKQIFKIPM